MTGNPLDMQCPAPVPADQSIRMAHGGGGRMMQRLLQQHILPALCPPADSPQHDAAILPMPGGGGLTFTSDGYVVKPLFFPGGNIGTLAVNGTVNDLAVAGARPWSLSAALILEEGLAMDTVDRVLAAMRSAADEAGVQIVTGDTKVVDRGNADGLYIVTAGIGVLPEAPAWRPDRIQPGDAILVTGDLGRHGTAIMAGREGLEFETALESDCAPLNHPLLALREAGLEIHCARDLTRGGLAGALVELADATGLGMHIRSLDVPVGEEVRGACEILGLDPLYVANEGRAALWLPADQAEAALRALRDHAACREAAAIGEVQPQQARAEVTIESEIGATRILDMLSGEQLPRIC